jgi:hypothetical protein
VVCLISLLIAIVVCEPRLYYVWSPPIESAFCLSNEGSLFGSGEGKSGHKENTLNSLNPEKSPDGLVSPLL